LKIRPPAQLDQGAVNRPRYLLPLSLALLTVLSTSSCYYVFTDAATRLAYDLKAGAAKLSGSDLQEWEIEHRPASFPYGVHGDYEIILNAVDQARQRGGSLGVTGEGVRSGTSYHLRFVTVPKELRIHKKKGEVTYLTLRKTGVPDDGRLRGNREIEVIAIR